MGKRIDKKVKKSVRPVKHDSPIQKSLATVSSSSSQNLLSKAKKLKLKPIKNANFVKRKLRHLSFASSSTTSNPNNNLQTTSKSSNNTSTISDNDKMNEDISIDNNTNDTINNHGSISDIEIQSTSLGNKAKQKLVLREATRLVVYTY